MIAAFAVAIAAGALAVTHFIGNGAPNHQHDAAQPIPVTAGVAKRANVPVFVNGLGTVQAFMNVAVKSRVDGEVTGVFFTEGQDVKKGDLLFQIDARPYQAAVAQTQANKQKDEAQLKAAQLVLQRYAELLKSGTQTQETYDNQKATVDQLQGSVAADQAEIDTAELNVQFTQIHAPLDGRTGARLIDPGNILQAGQNATLVTIAQIMPIFVSFTVPQEYLDQIRENQAKQELEADAYSSDGTTELSSGKLTFINNQVDTGTGTIQLKATFGNADKRLWPGEFVNIRLIVARHDNAVTVPAETVMEGPNGLYVYVIRPDQTVEHRDIQVLSTQDGIVAIEKGLQAGERVVVNGQLRLADGAKIVAIQQSENGDTARPAP